MTTATLDLPKSNFRALFTFARLEGFVSVLTGIWVTGLLIYGWTNRSSPAINPETGFGYALGIIGGSMMILLLFYPLRKRIKFLRSTGSVGFWFRFHMLLGLLGPVAILFHSRFTWGALNSAVALTAMLIVAGSGLIGRFLYSRVHRGFSGRKLEVRALLTEMHDVIEGLDQYGQLGAKTKIHLQPFENAAVVAGSSFWNSATAVISLGTSTRVSQFRIRKEAKAELAELGITGMQARQVKRGLLMGTGAFFAAVRRAGEYAFYDRMLRLWHILHLPLFFILVATAILHIVAVHMY
jgi:hypothetical protein